MEEKIVVKEYRGEEEFWMLISNDEIYINVPIEKRRMVREKMEKGEKQIFAGEEISSFKIREIREIASKKSGKSINITNKKGETAIFDAETKEIKTQIMKEINGILGEKYEIKEKKYSMYRRIITPSIYTVLASAAGMFVMWLASEQPVLVKRDMIVRRSVAIIIETLQFIEGIGEEKARILAMIIVAIPLLYMALRIVKPPVNIVIEEK